jgi:diguanylate cyclase (GGDEF)-like protein/PAS domain S-box-containing protein
MDRARESDANVVLRQLLERYPEARISAMAENGNPQPVPAGLPLGPRQAAVLSAGLAGYLPEDRPSILAGFDRALTFGVGHAAARAVNDPQTPLTVHLVDMRPALGVLISVVVNEASGSTTEQLRAVPVVAPRIARLRKSVTATLLEVDEATTEILGWHRDEMLGRRSLEFIHPDDQALAIESWLHLMTAPDQRARVRLRHQARDGSWIWFETSNTNQLASADPHVLTEMIDISAEMAAQYALEAREQLLSQLAQALPLGVFRLDVSGGLDYTNSLLCDILGIPWADVAADLVAAVPADQRSQLEADFEAVLDGAPERVLDVQLEAGGDPGREKHCQFTLRPLLTGNGRVTGLVGCVHDVTDSVALRRELERQAAVDGLTGCLNRHAVISQLESVMARGRELGSGTSVVFVDLDLFKNVNDQLGHAAGDELLRRSAERLRQATGADAAVGRLGGDEFLVVCPEVGSDSATLALGSRISDILAEPISLEGGEMLRPSASVGVAWSPDSEDSARRLIARADSAMYAAKRAKPERIKPERIKPEPPADRLPVVPLQHTPVVHPAG